VCSGLQNPRLGSGDQEDGQPRQKVSETPMSTDKVGMVAHVCHPSMQTAESSIVF
jgi:hypothetical protein